MAKTKTVNKYDRFNDDGYGIRPIKSKASNTKKPAVKPKKAK